MIHPFSPTGKPMWRGEEAFREAEALVAVAEKQREKEEGKEGKEGKEGEETFSFVSCRSRMLRPAEDARQAREFAQRGVQRSLGCSATPVGGGEAQEVLPGVSLPFDDDENDESFSSSAAAAAAAALVVEGGLVVEPRSYLRHLWAATVEAAEAAGGSAVLDCASSPVTSLAELDGIGGNEEEKQPRFAVVVVAAGAASGSIAEVGGRRGDGGVGSCELVQGWTATVAPSDGSSSSFPRSALLGKTYAAPRSRRSNGNGEGDENEEPKKGVVSVGATRSAVPLSAPEALAQCRARGRGVGPGAASEAEEASRELLGRFAKLWPEAAGSSSEEEGKGWSVVEATSGVRARPRRSGAGRPPLAGKIERENDSRGGNWWVIGGLGSRGLLYSAWLAKEVARAALRGNDDDDDDDGDADGNDGDDDGGNSNGEKLKPGDLSLDPELTRWKRWRDL